MRAFKRLFFTGLMLLCGGASAQQAVFDAVAATLTIPAIRVGAATYANVTMRPTASGSFAVTGAALGASEPTITNELSPTTGIMSLPKVRVDVGSTSVYYKNVTFLIRAGTLEFDLTGGQPDSVSTSSASGSSTLTIQVALTSGSVPGLPASVIPPVTVNNVPKPASQTEFCTAVAGATGPQSLSAVFTQAGVTSTSFSIDKCSFANSVGSVEATLKVNAIFLTVDLKYRATYTYK